MKYIRINNTDLEVSRVCLGSAQFGEKTTQEESFERMDRFIEAGGNFIDTANVYGKWLPGGLNVSERIIGAWLKSRNAYGKVIIGTKGAHPNLALRSVPRVNEQAIRADLDESRAALGLETIDLYWLHRDDPSRPVEEIIDILEKLRAEGLIRYYGLSNYSTARLEQARAYLDAKGLPGPYAVENRWALARENLTPEGKALSGDQTLEIYTDTEHEWHCRTGIAEIPYSSTAGGFFARLEGAGVRVKDGQIVDPGALERLSESLRTKFLNDENLRMYERLLTLKRETGHSLQALALAWFSTMPFPAIPISFLRTDEQMTEFLEAGDLEITGKDYQ